MSLVSGICVADLSEAFSKSYMNVSVRFSLRFKPSYLSQCFTTVPKYISILYQGIQVKQTGR